MEVKKVSILVEIMSGEGQGIINYKFEEHFENIEERIISKRNYEDIGEVYLN